MQTEVKAFPLAYPGGSLDFGTFLNLENKNESVLKLPSSSTHVGNDGLVPWVGRSRCLRKGGALASIEVFHAIIEHSIYAVSADVGC